MFTAHRHGDPVMWQGSPFSQSRFAVLNAPVTSALSMRVMHLTSTFQWYYDYNPQNTSAAPATYANSTNHQLFVTLSSPRGVTIKGRPEIDSPPSAKYPKTGAPHVEFPTLSSHFVTANAWRATKNRARCHKHNERWRNRCSHDFKE